MKNKDILPSDNDCTHCGNPIHASTESLTKTEHDITPVDEPRELIKPGNEFDVGTRITVSCGTQSCAFCAKDNSNSIETEVQHNEVEEDEKMALKCWTLVLETQQFATALISKLKLMCPFMLTLPTRTQFKHERLECSGSGVSVSRGIHAAQDASEAAEQEQYFSEETA